MAKRAGITRPVAFGIVALAAFLAVSAYVWRDDILRTWLDPKQPFQTYAPPPAPDYAKPSAWAILPAHPAQAAVTDPPADVFFVHPTTFDGGRDWLGPIGEPRSARLLERTMLPNYAGPFARVGRVFAPRYRQASLYALLTNKEDAQEARRFAYGDVARAFDIYLARYASGRPLILAGVEQGGSLVAMLLDRVSKDPALRSRLVAAYLIETPTPAAQYAPGAPVPACAARKEAQCVLAWLSAPAGDKDMGRRILEHALVWDSQGRLENLGDRQALCVNPMTGAVGEPTAPLKRNLGAVNATGLEWGVRPGFLPRQVAATCTGGLLRVNKPASPSLQPSGSWADRLKAPGYNTFYADIEADALARLAAFRDDPKAPRADPPMGAVIDIPHSPIHVIN